MTVRNHVSRRTAPAPRSNRHALLRATLALAVSVFGARALNATTFIPTSVEDLTRSSPLVLIGHVASVDGDADPEGRIYTRVRIEVERALKGDPGLSIVTLREPGGRVGDLEEVVFGTPAYSAGERVVVFVAPAAGGTLRTNQLALGKFRIEVGDSATVEAVQHLGSGVTVLLPPDGSAWRPRLPLDELIDRIRETIAAESGTADAQGSAENVEGSGAETVDEVSAPFMLFTPPGRFFEADEGAPLGFLIDDRGDSILGAAASRRAVDDAFATWTGIGSASIELADAGLTSDLRVNCEPGRHLVLFDDPHDEIPAPVRCTGTLGVGGFCSTSAESKAFNGETFERALRGRLTFADGWNGCPEWTACNLAEIATHEIGHAIGIWHSSEDAAETDLVLSDATMYFLAHFDGRCAAVRQDDVDAVSFLYPTDTPPTIATSSPLPDGVFRQPYFQELAVIGGRAPFNWSENTESCPGFPGLSLTAAGTIEGAPTAQGNSCFGVQLTDADGNRHTKRLDIFVAPTGPTSTPSPTPAPFTPTPTRPLLSCAGDCNGDRFVRISEIVTGVNIGLSLLPLDRCRAADASGNGAVEINEIITAVNNGLSSCPA